MLHHVSLGVTDLAQAARFYDHVLVALGYRRIAEGPGFVGYGLQDGEDPFYLASRVEATAGGPGTHVAFAAPSRAAVDAFFYAGLAAGGTNHGAPGLRPHYGPQYYAAYLRDPMGHRIEAVHIDA